MVPLLMALTLVLGLLVASEPAQAQSSPNLQASGQDIDSSTVAPNTAVTTQSVSATDPLSGSAGWVFQMGSPSQAAVTSPEISVESGNPASGFSSGGACSGVTAQTATLPFTWSEASFPGSGCPGPYQLTANLGSFTPVTFSPGFDSYRTVNTVSVAAGGTQNMTVGVTAQASDLGTAAAQFSVQWSSSGQTGMASASVTDTGSGNPVPNCPQPDPGTAACLSSAPTTFPNPGSQWTLNHPVVGDEYDFGAVLDNQSGTAITSLPNVTVTGIPNSAPPDIQNQTSTGTSATLLDSTLDGSTPGSGAVTFSAGEEANWTLNLQHETVVDYQGYPSQGGGGGGGLSVMPNSALADGSTVSVSGTGLQANTSYQLEECDPSGCDPTNSVPITTDGSGNFSSTPFTVHESITVDGSPATCTVVGCSIEATGTTQQPPPTAGITFGGGGGGGGGGSLNVAPNSGLGDGTTVSVSGGGLQANTGYQLQECDPSGCDPTNSVPVTTDGSGNFGPTPFTVHENITVNGSPVDCAPSGCAVAATGPQQPPPFQAITFAVGLSVTPSTNLNDQSIVSASGSDLQPNATYLLEECTAAGCDPSNSVSVTTDGTGSFGPTSFTVNQDIDVNGTQVDCAFSSCSIEATGQGQPAPSVQITFFSGTLYPSTTGGLLDGQPISVTSDRLAGGTTATYGLYECTTVACDPSTLSQVITDSFGHVSTIYTVHQHISYADPVTGSPDDVNCYSTQCYLQAFDSNGAAVTGPSDIWFAGSPLQDASLFGTVTLPGGIALPPGTESGVEACEGGPCTSPGGTTIAQPGSITTNVDAASTNYGFTSLTPGQQWDVVAWADVETATGPVTLVSSNFTMTATAGEVVVNDFTIEGDPLPAPSGGFATGKVLDLLGNAVPDNPFGGPDYSPQSGVLACPGGEVFGDPDCTDITNLLTPTNTSTGDYNFWLPTGTWNLAPYTTFAGIPGAPAITGDYHQVTITNDDPVVNLVIPLALTLTYTGPTEVTNGATAVLSGTIVDQNGNPIGDHLVTLSLGTQSCTAWTGQTTGIATCPIVVSQAVGPASASMDLTQTPQYEPSSAVSGYVQAPQTITFTSKAPTNAVYGGTHYKVTAIGGGSHNPVTFSLGASSSGCSLTGAVVNFTGVGTCVIDANQAGNTEYSAAPQVQQSFAVAPASTKTALSLTTPVAYGAEASADFTVTVSATKATPTGTVAVNEGSTTLCTITLSSGTGTCSLTAAQLPAGRYTVAAVYSSSNANLSGSTSAAKTLAVKAAPTTTALSLTTPVTYGAEGSADFTVTVSATGATPTGTVAVREGTTTLCTITLSSGTGECSLTAAQLPARSYAVAAVYSSSTANFSGSRSTAETLVVTKAGSTLTAKAPTTTTSGAKTAVSSSGTLTSSVSGLPIAGQKVIFTLNGTGSPSCSATTDALGVASCSVTVTTSVYDSTTSDTAIYVGNADYLSSQATEPA